MAVAFVNPPPPGDEGDFTYDPIYQYGSPVLVQWSGNASSLVLWQLQTGGTTTIGNLEYLVDVTNTENSSDVGTYTDFNWQVQTTKNLSLSNRFILELYDSGQTTPLCDSHYFEIRGRTGNFTLSTIIPGSSTGTSMSPTTTFMSTASGTGTPSAIASSVRMSVSGLSSGAKIGMGFGIPTAMIIGFFLGWMWFAFQRRRRAFQEEIYQEGIMEEWPKRELDGDRGTHELHGSEGGVELAVDNKEPPRIKPTHEQAEEDPHSTEGETGLPNTFSAYLASSDILPRKEGRGQA